MDLLSLWQDMTIMELVITLLIIGLTILANAYRRQQHQIKQMDKLLLLVCDRSHRDLVNIHRNGDYEIAQPLNKDG